LPEIEVSGSGQASNNSDGEEVKEDAVLPPVASPDRHTQKSSVAFSLGDLVPVSSPHAHRRHHYDLTRDDGDGGPQDRIPKQHIPPRLGVQMLERSKMYLDQVGLLQRMHNKRGLYAMPKGDLLIPYSNWRLLSCCRMVKSASPRNVYYLLSKLIMIASASSDCQECQRQWLL